MKWLLIILALVGGVACGLPFGNLAWVQAENLCVVSYNVENLFHPKHDTVAGIEKDDLEWTPEGERRWSYSRYYRKVENIARVLTNIGEWDGVDVAGLQEVENALCVKRLCNTLRRGEYDFVHYESPDPRGIDVALIYKKSRIDTIATRAIRVSASLHDGMSAAKPLNDELITRDILYVCAKIKAKSEGLKANGDTIHFFVCHLPSQRGGKAESEWKRKAAKQVLQQAVDSVYGIDPEAKIVVMGDMNSEPAEDIRGMRNRMKELKNERVKELKNERVKELKNERVKELKNERVKELKNERGTHKYQGRWSCLDQFYTSAALDSISEVKIYNAAWIQEPDKKYLDLKPKRTFNGFRYQRDGFSDHLPIVLKVLL